MVVVLLHRFFVTASSTYQIKPDKQVTFCLTLQELDRRRFLLRYVQGIQPEVMEDFVRHAPAHVGPSSVLLLRTLPAALVEF